MKVALIDVDSHNFPNLVLMKLSAWHKARGDEVTLLSVAMALQEEIFNEKALRRAAEGLLFCFLSAFIAKCSGF